MRRYRSGSWLKDLWSARFGQVAAVRRWADRTLAEFQVSSATRGQIHKSLVQDALHLAKIADELSSDGNSRVFVDSLLDACRSLDSPGVRHKSLKLHSYVDVSVQWKALLA